MEELEGILLQRVRAIVAMQKAGAGAPDQPMARQYDGLTEWKRSEKTRSIREARCLNLVNGATMEGVSVAARIYDLSVKVFSCYDDRFLKYKSKEIVGAAQSLARLFYEFFDFQRFTHQCRQFAEIMKSQNFNISLVWFLGSLSEWSRLLFSEKLRNFKSTLNQTYVKQSKSFDANKMTTETKRNTHKFSFQTNTTDTSELSISNKASIHAYLAQELKIYYRLLPDQCVDESYLKTIRKKKISREQLWRSHNIKKICQVLTQQTDNKLIINAIKNYEKQYFQRYPKPKRLISKSEVSPNIFLSPLSPIKRSQRNNTEASIKQKSVGSLLLSPKTHKFQFMNQEETQNNSIKKKNSNCFESKEVLNYSLKKKNTTKNQIRIKAETKRLSSHLQNLVQNNELEVTFDEKLKESPFLRCSSIKSKLKDELNANQKQFYCRIQQSAKRIKNLILKQKQRIIYQNLEVSKHFQFSDLKLQSRCPQTKMFPRLQENES